MKFTLRHTLLAVAAIALIIAAWIATANHIDHQGDGYSVEQLEAALRSVDETDPESDVSRRTNSRDFRFAGCWGEPGGPFFPGVPQSEWQGIRDAKDYWTFDGTTDALESRHHHRLIDRAWQYAKRYNADLKSRKPTSN